VKTFDELKALLTEDLVELMQLEGDWPATVVRRHVKEQEIGRHCYQAEEDLSTLDLDLLKKTLGIDNTRWRRYKTKCIEGAPQAGKCNIVSVS